MRRILIILFFTLFPIHSHAKAKHVINIEYIQMAIHFASKSAKLQPSSFPILDDVVAMIRKALYINRFVIEGYTDSAESPGSEHQLGLDRAKAVYDYLIEKGIEPRLLKIESYGNKRPVGPDPQDSDIAKAINRRVEFCVIAPDGDEFDKRAHDWKQIFEKPLNQEALAKLGKIIPVSNLGVDEVSFIFSGSPYEKELRVGRNTIDHQVADLGSVNLNLVDKPSRNSPQSLQSIEIEFINPIAVNLSEFKNEFGSYHREAKHAFEEFRFGYPKKKFGEKFIVMEGEWQEERYWKNYAIVLRVQSVSEKIAQVSGVRFERNSQEEDLDPKRSGAECLNSRN